MNDDEPLLRQYTGERSEAAFRELVSRHIDLVYSAALRVVGGDRHLAQDVTQIVFSDLARKASSLPRGVVLAGWLHRHTSFTAAKVVRTERRRQSREQAAMEIRALDEPTEPDWEAVAPHLDEGLDDLSAADRDAIVLRFLKAQDFRAIGAALGVSEDAAQKRVARALEKLRALLTQQGVTLTVAAMASLLATKTVTAAPAGLAASVTAASLAGGAGAGSGISLTTIKVLAMTKLKAGVAGALVIAAVAIPVVVQQHALSRAREEARQVREENRRLRAQADQVVALAEDYQRLSNLVAQFSQTQARAPDQLAELLRLRAQVPSQQGDSQRGGQAAGGLADLLNGPEMQEMMKPVLGMGVDKSYARLFAALRLPPEQSTALRELILEKRLAAVAVRASRLRGAADGIPPQEQAQEVKTKQDQLDDRIKQLLGTDNFAQFRDYERTESIRFLVGAFEDQLSAGAALNPDQEQQLIKAMAEERSSLISDEGSKQERQPEALDQRYLARARQILSSDQFAAFDKYLANQRQIMATMSQVSAKLFAGKTGN